MFNSAWACADKYFTKLISTAAKTIMECSVIIWLQNDVNAMKQKWYNHITIANYGAIQNSILIYSIFLCKLLQLLLINSFGEKGAFKGFAMINK